MLTKKVLPNGQMITLVHIDILNADRPARASFRTPVGLPSIALPIDWTKDWTLLFPILGNNRYGCCMYDAGIHIDQAMTGSVGTEAVYDENVVIQAYLRLSGGDRGLSEGQIVSEWTKGLCGNSSASILDSLDIDVTDTELVKSAIYLFGGVQFIFTVPDAWINSFANGVVWDAPATPDPRNGHGVAWLGVNEQDRVRLATWGGYVWITAEGVKVCNPSGFVPFSLRWFDPNTGLAPNGLSYDQLVELWVQAGGNASKLPANPFKTDLPPSAV